MTSDKGEQPTAVPPNLPMGDTSERLDALTLSEYTVKTEDSQRHPSARSTPTPSPAPLRRQDGSLGATVTTGNGNHNRRCAEANGRVCRCTGCGGSLHGWGGWVSLANEVKDKRQVRRQQVEAQWTTHYRPPPKRLNEKSKMASTDLARLDIADWLADQGVTAHPHPTGDTSPVEVVVPEQWLPHSAITKAGRQPEPDDQPTRSLGDIPEPCESLPGQAKSGDESENRNRGSEPQTERSERGEPDNVSEPSPVDQVMIFAEAMTSVWKEIAAELGDDAKSRDIKRQLAYHGWCDLFIGLVRVIEACRNLLEKIPESAKNLVKQAILGSSLQAKRSYVTRAVVDVVVDRVWQAFKGAMCGQVPLLSIITSEDALRSLRILAVFTCPAPEKHKEVCDHALKPLGDDAKKILTAQTKARLAKLFDEWTSGDNNWPLRT